MNIQQAREEIIRTVRAYTAQKEDGTYVIPALRQRPLLLIGPPGIGKTAVMEQAARECRTGFVSYTMTHHTRQSALGLPYIERRSFGGEDYAVTEYTMSEIIASVYRCMEETGVKNGLLFLDEINCVSETLAPAILQFLQNKTFGSHRLPEGWVLAAAGNPPEYNKSVHEFDIATLDRLKYITVEADYDAWRSYALQEAIHGAILAYLDTHPGQFYILKQTYASRTFATARGWEDLSCMLKEYEALDFPVDAGLICQYLQDPELAEEFALFYQLYRSKKQHLPIAQMLAGEEAAGAACQSLFRESSFKEQIDLVHLMLSCINEKLENWKTACRQKERFSDTAKRLIRFGKQKREEHQSQMAQQETQQQAIQHTKQRKTQQTVQQETSPTIPMVSQSIGTVMDAFLLKEREILKVRREHALSPESELEEMRQTLSAVQRMEYRLREENTLSQIDNIERLLQHGCNEALQCMEHTCRKIAEELLDMLKYGIRTILSEDSAAPIHTIDPGSQDSRPEQLSQTCTDSPALIFFLSSLHQNPIADSFFRSYPDNPCAPYWEQLDFAAREKAIKEWLGS